VNTALAALLWERIEADPHLKDEVGLLIMAAADGAEALLEALEGLAGRRSPAPPVPEQAQEPPGAYLGPVTVEGFRGVGRSAVLPLEPGPGLTLVVGRNGSGKSSFAEAVEILFTEDNRRWSQRSLIWREGWRNLHQPQPTQITVDLTVEGTRGGTRLRRHWPRGAELDHSVLEVQPHGRPKSDRLAVGWEQALTAIRPFLSYNELGSMLDEGPSKLYDALSSVLGLDELVAVEKLLGDARKTVDRRHKDSRAALQPLMSRLEQLDDDRAGRCVQALKGRRWDIEAAEAVLAGMAGGTEAADALDLLRRLCSIEGPNLEQVIAAAEQLCETTAAVAAVAGTDAARALALAELLQQALDFHAGHGDGDCPVCGRQAALNATWHADAQNQMEELRAAAKSAVAARSRHNQAIRTAQALLTCPPEALGQAARVGVDASLAMLAWQRWAQGPPAEDPQALAEHLEHQLDPLLAALDAVRVSARDMLDRKESQWRPIARDLTEWLATADQAQRGLEALPDLKSAEAWMKQTSSELRDQRFTPIAAEAQRIWGLLRQHSNVDLGPPQLEGTGTRRRVKLEVTVDGVGGAALGVMSQGELHSLALSLFLPRAMLPESPFRFLVLDDPVQSMDPARVDGLAHVLDEVARTRQLVVFSHDDRLAEAIRRLGIDARILEVTRQPGSVVTVIEALDPVDRHLRDATVIACDRELPPKLAARLAPGFCRSALEAACAEAARRRRLGRGDPHVEVEELLVGLTRSRQWVALALFDNPSRAGEVHDGLRNRFGGWAVAVFRAVNDGAHGHYNGDLAKLTRDTRSLAAKLRGLG
jgi:energy-coupling factor transporter ATP-binding protein EcfA2